MPITSHQMSGMIGGQQAMFGNFASYAQQISPGFQGQPPTYANPMAGAGSGFAPPPPPMQDPAIMGAGPRAISAIGNVGLPALGTAAMLGGSMLEGGAGRFFGNLDPFSAGLGGFARGAGLRSGGMGIMSNMGRIASGGMGSIARAGLAGVGGAIAGALPIYAAGQAVQYGVGQMVQGAQFQNQVQGVLDQNFRFQNSQSQSGYGFSRAQGADIAGMIREMGHSDMMTGPQELLRVMKSGTQQGLFRAVQDVKEFKKRFTDMVGSLKEVAQTMNTTLEGAMPFFSQARQMGFWTPNDIARNAQQVRQTASAGGISVAQTQQMMAQGAQMARSIGAGGATGAMGMQRSLELVGGGLRGGAISEQALSEATGGLMGPEAVQSMAGTMQAGMTRFARSSRARWALAAMGRNGFTSLDPARMQDLMSGTMGLGDISRGARRNISQQGAFNFVNNEEELRGELLKQGPMGQLGFIRSMVGSRLYGDDPRNKLISRRLVKRGFGFSTKQADLAIALARRAPQIQAMNEARGASEADQLERTQEEALNRSWEGVKRKASRFIDVEVKERFQKFGAAISRNIGDYLEKSSDKLWGRASAQYRFRGIGEVGMDALQAGVAGDTRTMERTFGRSGDVQRMLGGGLGAAGTLSGPTSGALRGLEGTEGGVFNMLRNMVGKGTVSNEKIDLFRSMGAQEYSFDTEAERERGVKGGEFVGGRFVSRGAAWEKTGGNYRAFKTADVERLGEGLSVAATGRVASLKQAKALGFSSVEEANKEIEAARQAMSSDQGFRAQAMGMTETGRELGRKQVGLIRSGKMGSETIRKFIEGGGKDMATMIHRLAAAHSQRGKKGGIDLTEEAKTAGLDRFAGLEDLEGRVQKEMEGAGAVIAEAISGKGPEVNLLDTALGVSYGGREEGPRVSAEVMKTVSEKGGSRFKRAILLMNSDKEADRKEASKMLLDLAEDKSMTPSETKALTAMADRNSPQSGEIMHGMKLMAGAVQLEMRGQFAEAVMRRGKRLFRNLGDMRDQFLGSLDEIRAKGDKKGESIGALVRSLQGESDPQEYVKKMQSIVALAGEADEGAVAEAAEKLRGVGGGEQIVSALTSGRQIGRLTRGLVSKTPRTAADAANAALGTLLGGGGISPEQMKKFMTGKDATSAAALQDILKDVPKENQSKVESLLNAAKSGNISNITESLQKQATSDAILRLSPDNILARSSQNLRKDIATLGEMGSQKGMHAEMLRQSGYLQEISAAVSKTAGIALSTGNVKEESTNA